MPIAATLLDDPDDRVQLAAIDAERSLFTLASDSAPKEDRVRRWK